MPYCWIQEEFDRTYCFRMDLAVSRSCREESGFETTIAWWGGDE